MTTESERLIPVVGQEIYIPPAIYLSRGRDDILGGRAIVTKVTEEKHGDRIVHGIQVKGLPNKIYYWENGLMQKQEELQNRFGEQCARPDPDEREEFNSHSIITHDVIRRWLKEGKERGATHVIIVSDTFDYTHCPRYVMPGENPRQIANESGDVKEVYSLSHDIESQLSEHCAFNFD